MFLQIVLEIPTGQAECSYFAQYCIISENKSIIQNQLWYLTKNTVSVKAKGWFLSERCIK